MVPAGVSHGAASVIAERFWMQLDQLRPFAYVAEGDALTVVVEDASVADSVWNALERLATPTSL